MKEADEAKPKPAANLAPKKDQGPLFRLPHGSVFQATYDGVAEKWTVVLTIPGDGTFEAIATGIHEGVRNAGRKWLKMHGTPAAPAPGAA